MKFKKRISLAALFLLFSSGAAFAFSPETVQQFEKANKAYRDGNFKEAIALYSDLAEKNPGKGVFYFNLGNSYHRANSLGPSILAYERALVRDPRDADTRFNLRFARGQIEYRIEDKRNWYLRAAETALSWFRQKEIALGAALFFFLFSAGWAYALFFRAVDEWGWKRKTALILFLIFAALLTAKNVQSHFIRDAIVMTNDAEVRYGPSDSDQLAFKLGEGIKVYVVDSREDWSRIFIANGESGWVQKSQIALVNS